MDDATIDAYRNQFDGDEEIEATLRRLRRDGRSRKEAVRILLAVLDVSLAEAKEVLWAQDTWAEARAASPDADDSDPPSASVPPAPG
jgi:hypothetical protein